ncbi:MAG: 3'-5' exonuclease [Hyphomonadaceae bacterium]|nr:3'-5' exonuclease [Hyphomonadaceae bacterium]
MTIALFLVIDLETTGMEPPHDIIEIGWTRLYFDVATKAVEIRGPHSRLFRNRQEMTPENIAVHHLTPTMLQGYEYCDEDAIRAVLDEERPDFLVAANCDFEKKWLTTEVVGANLDGKAPHWLCTIKAASRLYPEADSHSNQAMRYRLGLNLSDELAMPPHRAGPDSFVTAHILGRFLSDGVRVLDMAKWTLAPRFMLRCPIGKKWRGKPWEEVETSFLEWMLLQSDMDADAQYWASVELQRRREAA